MTPDELAYQDSLLHGGGVAIPLAVDEAFKPSLDALLDLIGRTSTPSGQVVRLGRFTTGDLDVLLVPNDKEVVRALVTTARMFAGDATIGTRLQIRAQELAEMILEATGGGPRRLPAAGGDEPRRSRPRSKTRSTAACAIDDPKVTPEELERARRDVGKPKAKVKRPYPGAPFSVSYGLGVDSTALLVGLAQLVAEGHEEFRPDFITMGDTGGELRETYAYLETMNDWLESVGFPQVTVCAEATQFGAGGYGSSLTLEQQCLVNQSMPSISQSKKAYAKCSKLWKQQAQNRWFKDHSGLFVRDGRSWSLRDGEKILKAIGYDADEGDRETRGTFRTKDDPDSAFYVYWYPLMDFGWDRARCIAEIEAAIGVVPPKSACTFCGMAKTNEIARLPKDILLRAILIEEVALRSRRVRHPKWLYAGLGENASKKRVATLMPLREKYLEPWLVRVGVSLKRWDEISDKESLKECAKWLRDNNKGIPQNVLMRLPGAEGNRGLGIGFAWSKFAIDEGLITQDELDEVVETAEAIIAEAPKKKGVRDAADGPVLSRTAAFTDVLGFRSTGGVYVAVGQGDDDDDEDEAEA